MSRRATVFRHSDIRTTKRSPGVSVAHLVSVAAGANEMLNGVTDIGPNSSVPFHLHNCEESVLVVEGQGCLDVDGTSYELGPGDVAWTPAQTPHRYRNLGEGVLRIFWTYGSADATRTIVDTGVTRSISSEITGGT